MFSKFSANNKKEIRRYDLEFTLSKVLELVEWVWDSEGNGHYTPIVSEIYSTIKYNMILKEINTFLEDIVRKPYVITKIRVIESNLM